MRGGALERPGVEGRGLISRPENACRSPLLGVLVAKRGFFRVFGGGPSRPVSGAFSSLFTNA